MKMISIDPGLVGTGFAIWHSFGGLVKLSNSGVIRPKKSIIGNDHLMRSHFISDELQELTNGSIYEVVIETPELWSGSAVSHASAAKGDLFSLAILVGVIARTLDPIGLRTNMVTPTVWKGQLSKKGVISRLNRKLEERDWRDHEADAVALGLWYVGIF